MTSQNNTAWMITRVQLGKFRHGMIFIMVFSLKKTVKITYDGTTVEYKMLLDCSDIPACGNVYEITGITEDGAKKQV